MSENKEKDFTERFNTLKDEALKAMKFAVKLAIMQENYPKHMKSLEENISC